jgi:hypothetical protein
MLFIGIFAVIYSCLMKMMKFMMNMGEEHDEHDSIK